MAIAKKIKKDAATALASSVSLTGEAKKPGRGKSGR